jgi:hypothetical protein
LLGPHSAAYCLRCGRAVLALDARTLSDGLTASGSEEEGTYEEHWSDHDCTPWPALELAPGRRIPLKFGTCHHCGRAIGWASVNQWDDDTREVVVFETFSLNAAGLEIVRHACQDWHLSDPFHLDFDP